MQNTPSDMPGEASDLLHLHCTLHHEIQWRWTRVCPTSTEASPPCLETTPAPPSLSTTTFVWSSLPKPIRLRSPAFLKEVWSRPCQLVLTSDIPSAGEKAAKMFAPRTAPLLGGQLLQSVWQKSTRRSSKEMAMRAVQTLWESSGDDEGGVTMVFRRLLVIMMEDSVLVPGAALWSAWMLAALSRDYRPNHTHRRLCLSLVASMASSAAIEHLPGAEDGTVFGAGGQAHPFALGRDAEVRAALATGGGRADMVHGSLALLIRCAFGGMQGDMRMLAWFAQVWSDRGGDGAWQKEVEQRGLQWQETVRTTADSTVSPPPVLPALLTTEVLPSPVFPHEAIDFHVGRDAYLQLLMEVGKRMRPAETASTDRDHLQRAVWHHRSGVYVRKYYQTISATLPPMERGGPRRMAPLCPEIFPWPNGFRHHAERHALLPMFEQWKPAIQFVDALVCRHRGRIPRAADLTEADWPYSSSRSCTRNEENTLWDTNLGRVRGGKYVLGQYGSKRASSVLLDLMPGAAPVKK